MSGRSLPRRWNTGRPMATPPRHVARVAAVLRTRRKSTQRWAKPLAGPSWSLHARHLVTRAASECRSIFLTVSRAMPNRLAASRWLRPSTWQASRTRRYRSTVYILPPSISKKIEGYRWQSFTPPAAGKSRRFRGLICHRRSHLLDRTIGDTNNAVVPHDLRIALERIETVAPKLANDPAFRQLSAAARR